ncbi:MAG: hypothetical protein Kow0031_02830 [Anaerolineae bacterium]
MVESASGSLSQPAQIFLGIVLITIGVTIAFASQTPLITQPDEDIFKLTNPATEATATWLRQQDGMVMVNVPAGVFVMGSPDDDPLADADEKPERRLDLARFWIDRTEVTNAQYRLCVTEGRCPASVFQDDLTYNQPNQPVVGVPWEAAATYCAWVGARLPTEAEWEKAARGADGRKFPWGDAPPTCEYAVISSHGQTGCGRGSQAWPVGSKPAGVSPYGALDMIGNVWEWTATDYDEFSKVLKGGSWLYEGRNVRAAYRYFNPPEVTIQAIGFRCAMNNPIEEP